MSKISFYGAGDDLVFIQGDVLGCGEYTDAWDGDHPGRGFEVLNGELAQRMMVVAHYDLSGTWSFAPGVVKANDEWPNWPMRFTVAGNGHSMRLEIDVPEETEVHDHAISAEDDFESQARHPVEPDPTRLLTASDLGLRWRVSPDQVYRLARGQGVPVVRLGRYYRFRLSDIEAFEAGGGTMPAAR